MTDHYDPDDDLYSYEDFEDIDELAWDPDALEPIDLAELDGADEPDAPSNATEALLERIGTLDEEIHPAGPARPLPDPRLVEDETSDEEDLAPDEETLDEEVEILDEETPDEEEFPEHEAPDEEEPLEEEPPVRERVIRIGGRARMQRLPLGPPPARPETSHRETGPEPPAPALDFLYRLALPLPPELGAEVLELRELGEIDDMPPPGIDLAFTFRADDLDAVESAIAAWARAHLPLELEITEIVAEVAGAQQYVAAWRAEPHATLLDAQIDLKRALAPVVAPLVDSLPAFQPRIVIGARVPAHTYPLVIGQMQRDFAPYAWRAESVALFSAVPGADAGEWELARTFGPSVGRE